MGFFDNLIYPTRPEDTVHRRNLNVAGTEDLANQGFTLDIYSLTANDSVSFSAFIDGFSDSFNSNWNAEEVFGRMDPIAVFSGTRRAISVSWKVPAANVTEAKRNLFQINKLISFLYPQYAEKGSSDCGATTINMGPLMRVKFGNLIQDSATGGGLLGYANGISYDHALEDGMFAFPNEFKKEPDMKNTVAPLGTAQYYPKSVRLNMELTVLHEHELGFRQDNSPRSSGPGNWPYTIQFSPSDRSFQPAAKPSGKAGALGFAAANGTQDTVQQAGQEKILTGQQDLLQAGAAGTKKTELLANQRRGEQVRKAKIAARVNSSTSK